MRIVVVTHAHCFDGVASAVLFRRFCREYYGPVASLETHGAGYGAGLPTLSRALSKGAVHAVLDYRYSTAAPLEWYFDHHRTAFDDPAARAHFQARRFTRRFFHDERATSCTKLMGEVLAEEYGFAARDFASLITWADRIDSASFDCAEEALERRDAVLKLASVVEQHGEGAFLADLVAALETTPLEVVAASERVRTLYRPIEVHRKEFVERVRRRGRAVGRVALVDLTDRVARGVAKFATYAVFPQCTYSVLVGRLQSGVRISIGYNPWCGERLDRDLSAICARHGGGGHPFVGGISMGNDTLRALTLAGAITQELNA